MHLYPELVDMSLLPPYPEPLWGVAGHFEDSDPRLYATPALGVSAFEAVAQDLAAKGQRMLGSIH